jgi:cytochrome c biogenesis factor
MAKQLVNSLSNLVSKSVKEKESELLDGTISQVKPYITKKLTHKICSRGPGFYRRSFAVFIPAVLTWLFIQSVAAIRKNKSRWVDILAVVAAFSVFALSWFAVVDTAWKDVCPKNQEKDLEKPLSQN